MADPGPDDVRTTTTATTADRSAEVEEALAQTERVRQEAELQRQASRVRAEAAEATRREAEQARIDALRRAERARSELLRRLQQDKARTAEAAAALAESRRNVARGQKARSVVRAQRSARIESLVRRAHLVTTATAADALDPIVDAEWRDAIDALAQAMQADPPSLPELPPIPVIDTETSSAAQALLARIRDVRGEAAAVRDQFLQETEQARLDELQAWFDLVTALDAARSEVRSKCSSAHVRSGLRDRLPREIEAQQWMLRAFLRLRAARLRALSTLGPTGWLATLGPYVPALLLLLGFGVLLGQVSALRRRLRRTQVYLRSLASLRRLDAADQFLARFSRPVLLLLAVSVVPLLLPENAGPEFRVALVVVRWLSIYWLLRAAIASLVFWMARRRQTRLARATRNNIERSAMLAARGLVAFGLVVDVGSVILGEGVLFQLVRGLLFVGLFVIGLELIRRWRGSVASAYLANFPDSRLSRAVEAHRDRWTGVFVVTAAFVAVMARSTYQLARDALLQFEQSRRALAYLFRLRLERKRDELPEVDVQSLPDGVRRANLNRPLKSDRLRIDRFPQLDRAQELAAAHREGQGGSLLLSAPKGCGKTTWLLRLAEELETDPTWLEPQVDHPLCRYLLGDGPPPEESGVIFIDGLHRFLLRAPGRLQPYERLCAWMEDAGRHSLLVVSIHEPFWRYVTAVKPLRVPFRYELALSRWSEDEIRHLLMARAACSGVVHEFDDLVVEDHSSAAAVARSGEAYIRLLWDHADGSPRVALHFWLRSLVPVGQNRVRVRLFRSPPTDVLTDLPDHAQWLMATLVLHDGLRPAEAAEVLRWPQDRCLALLEQGADRALLETDDHGRYRPPPSWERTVERHLRRRNYL
jgi:hypothetical protein